MLAKEMRHVFERDRKMELRLRLATKDIHCRADAVRLARSIIGEPQAEVVNRIIYRVREL